jgi:hypothetical protein
MTFASIFLGFARKRAAKSQVNYAAGQPKLWAPEMKPNTWNFAPKAP